MTALRHGKVVFIQPWVFSSAGKTVQIFNCIFPCQIFGYFAIVWSISVILHIQYLCIRLWSKHGHFKQIVGPGKKAGIKCYVCRGSHRQAERAMHGTEAK